MNDAGDLVFACVVIVANMKVFVSTYRFDWGAIILQVVSFLAYLLGFAIVSYGFTMDD